MGAFQAQKQRLVHRPLLINWKSRYRNLSKKKCYLEVHFTSI